MYDSPEELLRQIQLGEDTTLELKAVRFQGGKVAAPSRNDLADELAAIADTRDGVLVLGVDDKSRDIEGIPIDRLEAVDRVIFEICNDTIKPPLTFRSFRIELPDQLGNLQPCSRSRFPRVSSSTRAIFGGRYKAPVPDGKAGRRCADHPE